MQINLYYASRRTQRSNYRSEDVFVEYPVCVISVAVVDEAVVNAYFLCYCFTMERVSLLQ